MLFILFQLGSDRYALEAARVVEVLPLVRVKTVPHSAPGIAGLFTYRGSAIPAIDLSALALGRPAASRLSTRLIVVGQADPAGAKRLLGLIAERTTETLRCEAGDFAPAGLTNPAAPYLGPVKTDPRGIIQWVDPQRLLPTEVREALFASAAESM